ncbi:lipopolysaccharide biosynthesis protein [bacterium]|nr:lipopolysaccharide biosynthesis protein [bacterium]
MKGLSDSKNIKLGVVLSYVGMGVSIIGSLFITNRVLNLIGDYNYGLYSFVNSITSWLTIVSSALAASFLRYATLDSQEGDETVGRINTIYLKLLSILGIFVLFVGLGIVLALYMCRIRIGTYSWEDSRMMYLLFGLSIFNIGLTMPTSIFTLFINYKKKFVFGKILVIFTTVLNFAGHFLIAYFTKNVVIIAGFTIIITLITFAINAFYCYRKIGISFSRTLLNENKSLLKSIIIFSSILLFNSIVDQINTNVDKTLLGFFSSPENVTKYQMAQQLAGYLVTMSVAVSGVFAPSIHEMVASNDQESLNRVFLKISKLQSIILCCVAFGFLTCGKDFVVWWIGDNRIETYYVCSVLMILSLGPLTLNSSIEIQRAENKHKFRAVTYFTLALANVGLSILCLNIFDPKYAIYACLCGTVVTTICSHWIAMNIYNKVKIYLPVRKYITTLLIYMLIGLLCFAVVFVMTSLLFETIESHLFIFIIQGSIFVILYLLVCAVININIVKKYLYRFFNREKGND